MYKREAQETSPTDTIVAFDFKAAADLAQDAISLMATTNQELTAQIATLHAEVLRLSAPQPAMNLQLAAEVLKLRQEITRLAACPTPSARDCDNPAEGKAGITGNGSGAGSSDIYREMCKQHWHGRLGRTHMVEVDKMSDAVKKELDCYLRRTISAILPIKGEYVNIKHDELFATLSVFGLRLEDRGQFADVKVFHDAHRTDAPTITRMRNYSACFYQKSDNWDFYWKGSAIETLLELARYRGLFDSDGFLKVVN